MDFLAQQKFFSQFEFPRSVNELGGLAASASRRGFDTVVACGGDGTFHAVLASARETGLTFGLLPLGSGNDIARGLGIPADGIEAARLLLEGNSRPIDLVEIAFPGMIPAANLIYTGAGGTGLDAEAARLATTRFRRLPGLARYAASALMSLCTFQPLTMDLQADGWTWTGKAFIVAVANAPSYGAGFCVAPEARMDDGWLNITIVPEMPRLEFLEALPLVLQQRDWRWPGVLRWRARKISLRTDPPALFHGDGEILGKTPAEICILPRAIRVVTAREI